MSETKIEGSNATLSRQDQVANIIHTMNTIEDCDVRNWSPAAREKLARGPTVDVLLSDGTKINAVPLLALVVVSPTFRESIQDNTDAPEVKVQDDPVAVRSIIDWVSRIARPSRIFSIGLPRFNSEMISLRRVALKLGMDIYVSHFAHIYRRNILTRMPDDEECTLLERAASDARDELLVAAAERLAYLRRCGIFTSGQLISFRAFLNRHCKLLEAVKTADVRAAATLIQEIPIVHSDDDHLYVPSSRK